jgi:hypothetical protein
MYRQHTVSVIVPAYNEGGDVSKVFGMRPSFVDRIYAVDDESTGSAWTPFARNRHDSVAQSYRAGLASLVATVALAVSAVVFVLMMANDAAANAERGVHC